VFISFAIACNPSIGRVNIEANTARKVKHKIVAEYFGQSTDLISGNAARDNLRNDLGGP